MSMIMQNQVQGFLVNQSQQQGSDKIQPQQILQNQQQQLQQQPPSQTSLKEESSKNRDKGSEKDKEKDIEKDKEKEHKVNMRTKHVSKYYNVLEEVGQGAYGRVYKAEYLKQKQYVALKKFESSDDKNTINGFPITALREIKLLKQLNHENIIQLREIIVTKASERNRYRGSTFLVTDYMDHDFAGLFKMKHSFSYPQIKNIIQQILEGVNYLHKSCICHRDLKIANILLNNKGVVKIADFGLARNMPNFPNMQYTVKVVTLWYRAPELLLGLKRYTTQIDMWSIGCILAEFLCGDNLLRGDGEVRQMEKIYELCGSPDENTWEGVTSLPYYKDMQPKHHYSSRLREVVLKKNPQIDEVGLNLLESLLTLNPKNRLTAEQALKHPFFTTNPLPEVLGALQYPECHEMTINKKKKKIQPISNPIGQFQEYRNVDDLNKYSNNINGNYSQNNNYPQRGGNYPIPQQFSRNSYQQQPYQKYGQNSYQNRPPAQDAKDDEYSPSNINENFKNENAMNPTNDNADKQENNNNKNNDGLSGLESLLSSNNNIIINNKNQNNQEGGLSSLLGQDMQLKRQYTNVFQKDNENQQQQQDKNDEYPVQKHQRQQ